MKVSEKHNALLRTLYGPSANATDRRMVGNAIKHMDEAEQAEFEDFQRKAGEAYLDLMTELDSELERLADEFPDEPDPRKWKTADWVTFDIAVFGHRFEKLWRTYAKQEDNFGLVWREVVKRLEEQ